MNGINKMWLIKKTRHSGVNGMNKKARNTAEQHIYDQYLRDGYVPTHGGAPDYIMVKYNDKEEINDVVFVEVKTDGDKLRKEQLIWKKVLEFLKLKYKLERLSKKELEERYGNIKLDKQHRCIHVSACITCQYHVKKSLHHDLFKCCEMQEQKIIDNVCQFYLEKMNEEEQLDHFFKYYPKFPGHLIERRPDMYRR